MVFPLHELTQGALIERLGAELGEREALIYPERSLRWTFADLERRSLELARGLLALGVEPGERVTLWADNQPDWIPLQFALARIGAILVTANTALQKAEIAYLLKQSRSAFAICAPGWLEGEYAQALQELVAEEALPELRGVVLLSGAAFEGARTLDEIVALGAEVEPERAFERTRASQLDDPANIQYTSGTTGFPKGVVLTHRNLVENAYAISTTVGVQANDRLLLQVPLFHCFGCVVSVLGATTHGIPLVALERFEPLAALRALREERCTLAFGAPMMYLAMLSHPEFETHRPEHLRAGIMAGTMCPEPLMHRVIDELGCRGMLVAYGLTEASPGVTCSHPDDPVSVRCGSVGKPLPGVSVRVVDAASGADCPVGTPGELWTSGPNVMQGYFENAEATAAAITEDGWLRTGDLATLDADGRVHIVGRIKEMIIRAGENVYPIEVEDALRAHPAVKDAAVFGLPDERLGEEVCAAVILEADAQASEAELLTSLEGRLAPFKRPTKIAFLDALPINPSGKVQKFRLPELCAFA